MSYDSFENSERNGQPIELYLFTRNNETFSYTTYHENITYLDIDYIPSSIRRDRVRQSMDVFKNDMYFIFPRTNQFASSFIRATQEHITTVTIFRYHHTDSEFKSYWKGRLIGGSLSGNEVKLYGESIHTSLRRIGIRAKFEYNCRHPLYGHGCGLNKSSFVTGGIVTDINTSRIILTVAEAATQADGYFTGGFVEIGDTTRFVTRHVGDEITLMTPYLDDIVGQAVSLYAGCDHLKTTCASKFSNSINYGGFSYIPNVNPFKVTPF